MPTTLAGRLLCASNCAYDVKAPGTVPKQAPYYGAAGFVDEPVGVAAGTDRINACLVGTTEDGVVVAFRGTLPPSGPDHRQTILDWLNDFHAELTSADGIQGKVHAGFWSAVDSLWAEMREELGERRAKLGAGAKVYVTGHSKGGAMANLAAARLKSLDGIDAPVCTFAAAHPGDEAFAAAYGAAVADSARYEFTDDIVPHAPPGLVFQKAFEAVPFFSGADAIGKRADLDYAPVGTLRFIDWDGAIVGDSPRLKLERFERLAKLVAALGFEKIVNDHSIACGSGYMTAVCPTDVCA